MSGKPVDQARRFLGTHQAARLLSVDAGTVIRWVDAGRLASFRTPGGHRRIPREEIFRFAEQYGWLLSDAGQTPDGGRP